MWQVNISVFVIFLACLLEVSALRCYKCNQTEIFTRKCVIDSADEVECAEGEVCSFGRTVKGNDLKDLVGCERKESCDADRANGCQTCDTNLCNIFARNVVSFENRIEITKLPSGETIVKEEHSSSPTINQPVSVPLPVTPPINNQFPFQFPFFNFPNFGFNNYGFTGGFNRPQQGEFHENFFKPPFFVSQTSQLHPPTQSVTQNYPPYAPFFSFAPFGLPQARPPYVHEPQIFPQSQEETIPVTQNELPQRPLVIITQPQQENEVFVKPIDAQVPQKVETTTLKETEQATTLKPPSLASSILQQFASNPSDPNRNPSISDLVLNLGATTTKPEEKPLETTTKQPLDIPVTIPELIENTENPEITELPTNKDFIALQTETTTSGKSLETTTLDSKNEISPTTTSPKLTRAAEEEDDDENDVNPSKNEPENLRFDIRREDEKVEEVKFPETFYFEPQSGDISVESAPQESAETPVFSKLR